MVYLLSIISVAFMIYSSIASYNILQYKRKIKDESVRGYEIESHYRKGFEASIIAVSLLFVMGLIYKLTS